MLRATDQGVAAIRETADAPAPIHDEGNPDDGTTGTVDVGGIDADSQAVANDQMRDGALTVPDAAADEMAARDATHHTATTHDAPTAATLPTLRRAARAVLDAWGDEANRETDIIAALQAPMASLHAVLDERAPRASPNASREPREGTKQARVLAMLHRPEGASGPAIAEAMGWAPHTVRGFLAGLKKKGIQVEVLERVRVVGANKEGAKGSFTVYRIGEAR